MGVQELLIGSCDAGITAEAAVHTLCIAECVPVDPVCKREIFVPQRISIQFHRQEAGIHNRTWLRPGVGPAEPVDVGVIFRHTAGRIGSEKLFRSFKIKWSACSAIHPQDSPRGRERGVRLHLNAEQINRTERGDHLVHKLFAGRISENFICL